MTKLSRAGLVALGIAWALALPTSSSAQDKVNPDARVLADFKTRVDAYMELHERVERESPPLKETRNPGEIKASQEAMAKKIRAARQSAKPGDIFTPEVRRLFRRLMYPEVKGPGAAETKEAIKEDAPKGVPMRVNAVYPENAPLPTVPPNLLAALPQLPDDLEYRIVGRHLILRDVHANVIVDYIPNAIQ